MAIINNNYVLNYDCEADEVLLYNSDHDDEFYNYHGYRGVQYVHWVMHKCIMVKAEGNEIHIKYVKSRYIFLKQGGHF